MNVYIIVARIAFTLMALSVVALVFNNFIFLGCFLYWWSETNNLAQSAWDAFALWVSVGFCSSILFLASRITLNRVDVATTKYAKRK